jgi:allantoin racemase
LRILLINPNTTASMTAEMVAAAERVVPDAEIVGTTARTGVAALDGFRDDVLGASAVVEEISANDGSFDAAILGCFAEPGLYAARELTRAPVVGIGEASYLTAMLLGRCFSVLTTLERGVPPIEIAIRLHGVESRCASIRATGLTVLQSHEDPEAAADALEREGRLAIEFDKAEVLCLGCAGMVGLRERLESRLGVPVVEAVPAAAALAHGLVMNRLATSKVRAFKEPEATPVTA